MFNPSVPLSTKAVMRGVQNAVALRSHYYVTGTVEASKSIALFHRLHERYDLTMDRKKRNRLRKEGRAVFSLFFHQIPNSTEFRFWLLRSDGSHPLVGLEQWSDARQKPIQWIWWYELIRLPVDVQHQRKMRNPAGKAKIKPVTWTWRIRSAETDEMKQLVRHSVHHRDQRLTTLIDSLRSAIGFRGTRLNVTSMYSYIREQCKKAGKECPDIPLTISWVGKYRAVEKHQLSNLVRRAQKT